MTDPGAWLVVIDMQRIFGDPASDWFTPRFAEAAGGDRAAAPGVRAIASCSPGSSRPSIRTARGCRTTSSGRSRSCRRTIRSTTSWPFGRRRRASASSPRPRSASGAPTLAERIGGSQRDRAGRRLDRLLRAVDRARRGGCRRPGEGRRRRVRRAQRPRPPAGARRDGPVRPADRDHGLPARDRGHPVNWSVVAGSRAALGAHISA